MSRTRYQDEGANPFDGAERHLSHPNVVGLGLSLQYVGAVATERTEQQTRNSVWFFNYARIVNRPAVKLAAALDMPLIEMRDALTDPDASDSLLQRFGEAVAVLRKKFEANLRALYPTKVSAAVEAGIRKAKRGGLFSTILGPYRSGKTAPFRDHFFRHDMDQAVFADLRAGDDMQGFCSDFGEALGLGGGTAKKVYQYKNQTLSILGTGIIKRVYFDEFQYIMPKNPDAFPEKLAFARHCLDKARYFRDGRGATECLSFIGCATLQFRDQLNLALDGRWNAGQFEGRQVITYTPDTLTRAEIEGIARHMAPEFDASIIEILADATEANPGLLGFLENLVAEVRFQVEEERKTLNEKMVVKTVKELIRNTRVEAEAKAEAAKQPRLEAA